MKNTRGITRLKYKSSSNGWIVRYGPEGARFAKSFSDKKYGSEDLSYNAAVDHYNDLRAKFPPRTYEEHKEHLLRKLNPESGVVGVSKITKFRKGKDYSQWVARWTISGKLAKKSFTISKHGDAEALKLAIKARGLVDDQLREDYNNSLEIFRPRNLGNANASNRNVIEPPVQAEEGKRTLYLHEQAERSSELRAEKLKAVREEHGKLLCEICDDDLLISYGKYADSCFEVHHTFPISKMTKTHVTLITELVCICPNCHRCIHKGNMKEIEDFIRLLKSQRT